jgi:hypothetical protein
MVVVKGLINGDVKQYMAVMRGGEEISIETVVFSIRIYTSCS